MATAECVIVVWSRSAAQSAQVLADAESALERWVLQSVVIDDAVEIPDPFSTQQMPSLVTWRGDPDDPEVRRFRQLLVARIRHQRSALNPRRRGARRGISAPLIPPRRDRALAELHRIRTPTREEAYAFICYIRKDEQFAHELA